ncbi:hydantoinase/oxoprolinase family protein [Halocella sp. SP3-1]|uniref:hydantoinase/oxoprolinase family protein n=1 Tax=Halocella sp. SP3-1 TaxID=2382161 RepID=UPI00257086F3|nr:hydantoinase/oxoprolinase family protein [Halocella sp. SP3-1]
MIGVDVGGTFTDISLLNVEKKELNILKVRSTVDDPSLAIVEGIDEILKTNNVDYSQVTYLAHGTTVATNTLIERTGAKTALITTKGFKDLLEIGDQTRPGLYNYFIQKPEMLIPSGWNHEVSERLLYNGDIYSPLEEKEVGNIVKVLKEKGAESVAVCTLFSYLNPIHEKKIVEIIKELYPDIYVSASHNLVPEFREYPRMSTTVLNAYLGPIMKSYVNNFNNSIKDMGIKVEPYVTQSNGSIISISETIDSPIRTAVSGPSAGVIAANHVAQLCGVKNIITFDMGGTSADVSLIENGEFVLSTDRKINGFPVKTPMIDIDTIGAGGGSIAWLDGGGALKVGPQSAGAKPGPAAYNKGGEKPTVTDANVVLGRLNPEYILGGRMEIRADLAEKSIKEHLSSLTDMNSVEAAAGIIAVVNSNMVRAIRVISVERGYDPREFALVSFGGAGSLHACAVAKELGIKEIIIPFSPGIFCSIGLLVADIKYDYVKSKIMLAEKNNIKEINEIFSKMISQGKKMLDKEGIFEENREYILTIDARYKRQNYELQLTIPEKKLDEEILNDIKGQFHKEHMKNYGYFDENQPLELINYRVNAIGKTPKPDMPKYPIKDSLNPPIPNANRQVYFDENKGFVECPIYTRDDLDAGHEIFGPAVVEQMDTTILINPGWNANVDEYLNIKLNYGGVENEQEK